MDGEPTRVASHPAELLSPGTAVVHRQLQLLLKLLDLAAGRSSTLLLASELFFRAGQFSSEPCLLRLAVRRLEPFRLLCRSVVSHQRGWDTCPRRLTQPFVAKL
ncbi:hypothetical protein ADK75_29175, partial [Streptomyces virginiae]